MSNSDVNVSQQNGSGNEVSMAIEVFEDIEDIAGDVEDIVKDAEDVWHVVSDIFYRGDFF